MVGVGEVTAKTVAAMDSTGARGDQEGPALVFVQQTGDDDGALFSQGILGVTRAHLELVSDGQNLTQEWILGILAAHTTDESPRDP